MLPSGSIFRGVPNDRGEYQYGNGDTVPCLNLKLRYRVGARLDNQLAKVQAKAVPRGYEREWRDIHHADG
jgi:hypothetical protein